MIAQRTTQLLGLLPLRSNVHAPSFLLLCSASRSPTNSGPLPPWPVRVGLGRWHVAALAACVVAGLRPAAAVTYPPRFDTTTISSASSVRTVWAGDVDGDGRTDVASATERDLVTWYKNGGVFALVSTPAMC
jgi:hypothetical protein